MILLHRHTFRIARYHQEEYPDDVDESLAQVAQKHLESRGVDVRTGVAITAVGGGGENGGRPGQKERPDISGTLLILGKMKLF